MVWIDTDGLRAVSASLATVRDSLLPPAADTSPSGCGFPELITACSALEEELRRAQIVQAREIDAVVAGAVRAAQLWERAEAMATGGHAR